jgi:hypothetical protein
VLDKFPGPFGPKLENRKYDKPQIRLEDIDGTAEVLGYTPDPDECEREVQEAECRSISKKENDRREKCWSIANERFGACGNGKKMPPLRELLERADIGRGRVAH